VVSDLSSWGGCECCELEEASWSLSGGLSLRTVEVAAGEVVADSSFGWSSSIGTVSRGDDLLVSSEVDESVPATGAEGLAGEGFSVVGSAVTTSVAFMATGEADDRGLRGELGAGCGELEARSGDRGGGVSHGFNLRHTAYRSLAESRARAQESDLKNLWVAVLIGIEDIGAGEVKQILELRLTMLGEESVTAFEWDHGSNSTDDWPLQTLHRLVLAVGDEGFDDRDSVGER
jgi:hypothetical protein